MSIHEFLKKTASLFFARGIDSPQLDAEILCAYILKKERAYLFTHPEKILTQKELRKMFSLVFLRLKRIPIAYLLGSKEFYGRDFFLSPSVLIPRSETEELVSVVLSLIKKYSLSKPKIKILDIGTGSGCIALTLAAESTPHTIEVTASDVSIQALRIAKKNFKNFKKNKQIQNPVHFIQSDIFSRIQGRFDIIVANLPYLSQRVFATSSLTYPELHHEPRLALTSNDAGLEKIKIVLKDASNHLLANGDILCEIGSEQKQALLLYIQKKHPSMNAFVKKDLAGKNRILHVCIKKT